MQDLSRQKSAPYLPPINIKAPQIIPHILHHSKKMLHEVDVAHCCKDYLAITTLTTLTTWRFLIVFWGNKTLPCNNNIDYTSNSMKQTHTSKTRELPSKHPMVKIFFACPIGRLNNAQLVKAVCDLLGNISTHSADTSYKYPCNTLNPSKQELLNLYFTISP